MSRRAPSTAGSEPLTPQRKWLAITLATIVLLPAHWSILAGLVSGANDGTADAPDAGTALAIGLAIVPFVFFVLAFASAHPRWPAAVLRAMGLALVFGVLVSSLAGDAVTGIVAGVGAGGIAALRADPGHNWRARAIAVAVGTVYTFALVRTVGALALLPAPIFPFTGIGVADHLSERRAEANA
jgi:hypothetical protein